MRKLAGFSVKAENEAELRNIRRRRCCKRTRDMTHVREHFFLVFRVFRAMALDIHVAAVLSRIASGQSFLSQSMHV